MYRPLGDAITDATFVDPNINTPQPDPLERLLSSSQKFAVQQLPVDFPAVLAQAKEDYHILKAGIDNGVSIDPDTLHELADWFSQFPRYWETIRPNYLPDYSTVVSAHQANLVADADQFSADLVGDRVIQTGLGVGPLIIAGILVAAVAGVAGVIWAIGYVKNQNNISRIITETVAGKLPPDILKKAIDESQSSGGFLGNIGTIVKWGAIGLAAFYLLPVVTNLFKSKAPANA